MNNKSSENKILSVITPSLNIFKNKRERWFHGMMKSVHGQTYENIEHIFIDGGSDDGTLEVLNSYKKEGWIDSLVSEKDSGIYSALNKGLRLASGQYINIMNTDDYFLDIGYYKKALWAIKKFNVDFVHANKTIKPTDEGSGFVKKGNELYSFFRMPFLHQTMVIKKELFDEIGFFDEKYKIAADYKWVIKMILADKKGFHIKENVLYSMAGGVSSDRQKCIEEVSRVIFESYGEGLGFSLEDCRKIYLRKFSLKLFLKDLFLIRNPKIRKSLLYKDFLALMGK